MRNCNILKSILIILISAYAASLSAQNLFVARGAKTLPQKGILLWQSFYYYDFDKSYNKTTGEFSKINGDNSKFSSITMLGYGILNTLEIVTQIPFYRYEATKNGNTDTSDGLGDIVLQTRYMLYAGNEYLPAFNVSLMGRFPTGDEDEVPALGDGTYDFGIVTFVSKKIMRFSSHLKLAYVFNGENDEDVDIGDEFVYALKCDFTLIQQIRIALQFAGFLKDEDRDKNDDKIKYSDRERMTIIPMINFRPIKGLNIRPKVIFPIESQCKGGKLADRTYVIDIFYAF
jgi:hypothetical protein